MRPCMPSCGLFRPPRASMRASRSSATPCTSCSSRRRACRRGRRSWSRRRPCPCRRESRSARPAACARRGAPRSRGRGNAGRAAADHDDVVLAEDRQACAPVRSSGRSHHRSTSWTRLLLILMPRVEMILRHDRGLFLHARRMPSGEVPTACQPCSKSFCRTSGVFMTTASSCVMRSCAGLRQAGRAEQRGPDFEVEVAARRHRPAAAGRAPARCVRW